ncbi:MAG: hypothetical protein ACH37Z_15625 [Anaerolineae bacterium]
MSRPRGRPRHVPARRHVADGEAGRRTAPVRVVPPVPEVPLVDFILALWWFRSEPYPIGALTGTTLLTV